MVNCECIDSVRWDRKFRSLLPSFNQRTAIQFMVQGLNPVTTIRDFDPLARERGLLLHFPRSEFIVLP